MAFEVFNLIGKITLNRQEAINDLKAIEAQARQTAASLGATFTGTAETSKRTSDQQKRDSRELQAQIKALADQVNTLRNVWVDTGQDTSRELEEVRGRARTLQAQLERTGEGGTAALRQISTVAASATRALASMNGEIARGSLAEGVARGSIFANAGEAALSSLRSVGAEVSKQIPLLGELKEKQVEVSEGYRAAGIAGGLMAGGVLAAGFALNSFLESARETIEATAQIADNANKYGMSITAIQELGFIASQTGSSLEALGNGANMLAKRAAEGGKQFEDAAKRIGLSVREANGELKSQQALLYEAARGLSQVQNQAEQTALAFALFGKSGAELLPTIRDGGAELEKLAQKAHDAGIVLSEETVKQTKELSDNLDLINRQIAALKNAVLLPIVISIKRNFIDVYNEGKELRGNLESARKIIANDPNAPRTTDSLQNAIQQLLDDNKLLSRDVGKKNIFGQLTQEARDAAKQIEENNRQLQRLQLELRGLQNAPTPEAFAAPTKASGAIYTEALRQQKALAAAQRELDQATTESARQAAAAKIQAAQATIDAFRKSGAEYVRQSDIARQVVEKGIQADNKAEQERQQRERQAEARAKSEAERLKREAQQRAEQEAALRRQIQTDNLRRSVGEATTQRLAELEKQYRAQLSNSTLSIAEQQTARERLNIVLAEQTKRHQAAQEKALRLAEVEARAREELQKWLDQYDQAERRANAPAIQKVGEALNQLASVTSSADAFRARADLLRFAETVNDPALAQNIRFLATRFEELGNSLRDSEVGQQIRAILDEAERLRGSYAIDVADGINGLVQAADRLPEGEEKLAAYREALEYLNDALTDLYNNRPDPEDARALEEYNQKLKELLELRDKLNASETIRENSAKDTLAALFGQRDIIGLDEGQIAQAKGALEELGLTGTRVYKALAAAAEDFAAINQEQAQKSADVAAQTVIDAQKSVVEAFQNKASNPESIFSPEELEAVADAADRLAQQGVNVANVYSLIAQKAAELANAQTEVGADTQALAEDAAELNRRQREYYNTLAQINRVQQEFGQTALDSKLKDLETRFKEGKINIGEYLDGLEKLYHRLVEFYRLTPDETLKTLGIDPQAFLEYIAKLQGLINRTGNDSAFISGGGNEGEQAARTFWDRFLEFGLDTLGRLSFTVTNSISTDDPRKARAEAGAGLIGAGLQFASGDIVGGVFSLLGQFGNALSPLVDLFAQLGDILKAFEPLIRIVVQLFAVQLKPALNLLEFVLTKILLPPLLVVGRLIAGIYNAIASAINAVLGWLGVHLDLIDLSGSESASSKPGSSTPAVPPGGPFGDAKGPSASLPAPAVGVPIVGISDGTAALFASAVNVFRGSVDDFSAIVRDIRQVAGFRDLLVRGV
ncbi:hypothetical protein [Meiothermus granaticius]|uniref:Uncharacterized protein n=1 Tax=Meiothermus granaticius NBRC 107808 TaxID=1227551 RepID=A0A399FDV5_9DEIN|nr:hypothetical protein [Meiothermus granaticius]RIH93985.1 hypothetical protein Mgrana_00071 [Meiothermus granaticius NBRC 107808]GEM88186.1 hypothetical protein MGR01S_28110 [Meiothermus granaticius NBRC 107808]